MKAYLQKLSAREKRVIAVLPAAIVLIGYLIFGPGSEETNDLQQRIEREQGRLVTPAQLAAVQRDLRTLREEVDTARRQRARAERLLTGNRGNPASGADTARSEPSPEQRLAGFGLTVLEDQPASAAERRRLLPTQAAQLTTPLQRLRVYGSYGQVSAWVAAVQQTEAGGSLLALEMEIDPLNTSGAHLWDIWLWR